MSNLNNMSDSKNLRETLEENISEEGTVTKGDQQQAAAPEGTVDKTKTEEKPEVFAEKGETKGKTPEELEAIYENWSKSYTQKRQKEREEIKAYQKQVADLQTRLDAIEKKGNEIQDPQLKRDQKVVQDQFDMGKLSVAEYTKQMRELIKADARSIADEVFDERFKQKDEDTTQNSFLEKFNSADGRFAQKFINPDSPEYDKTNAWIYQQVAQRMADELDAHIAANGTSKGFDVEGIAKKHIAEIDSYIDSVVKSRVQSTSSQLRTRASETQKSNPRGVGTPSSSTQRKGLRELLEEKVSDAS